MRSRWGINTAAGRAETLMALPTIVRNKGIATKQRRQIRYNPNPKSLIQLTKVYQESYSLSLVPAFQGDVSFNVSNTRLIVIFHSC
jgi:hypothetical protein